MKTHGRYLLKLIACLCLGFLAHMPLAQADAVRGGVLFNTPSNCIRCHSYAARQGRTASQITGAIASVSAMRFLGFLTQTDIQDIADYLNPAPPPPVVPKTGWWWYPSEAGSGFTIEKRGNSIFMAGYLYDPSGRARWYAAGPTAMNGSTFTSTLTTYLGGQTLTGAYRIVTGTIGSGQISITFTDPSHGTLTWGTPAKTIPIQRYDIVAGGASAAVPAGTPEAGWWWNDTEGGRGYAIEIQNGTMFLAGYMYDEQGNPIWYASGPTAMTGPTTYQGVWQQYGNGQSLAGTYKLPSVVNDNVGAITIEFTSTTTATLTLPDGRQIALTRYQF